jgi:hypothetical protein
MLASILTFRMPGAEALLDNPQLLKVPYGVALALTTLPDGILSWKMGEHDSHAEDWRRRNNLA